MLHFRFALFYFRSIFFLSARPLTLIRFWSTGFPSVCLNEKASCSINIAGLLQGNTHFMKKLPAGAEASNVLIGEVEFLQHHITAFVRLKSATLLGDLTEVIGFATVLFCFNRILFRSLYQLDSCSFCSVQRAILLNIERLVVQSPR